MRSFFFWIVSSLILSTTLARRWRFATGFPGKVEPNLPGPVHKPFDDLADLERVFDTKQVSKTKSKKQKGVVAFKQEDKTTKHAFFGI